MQVTSASRIGIPGKALSAVCHLNRQTRLRTAVLLCNPLGIDGVGAHRTLRVLAESLASSGRSSLRFDYRYTGDSDGRCEEASLDDWLDDICDADAHLRAVTGCAAVAWLGLGAGANLALAAARRAAMPPVSLTLWEPLETETDFAAEFRDLSQPIGRIRSAVAGGPTLYAGDAQVMQVRGFPIPASVADGFAELVLEKQSPPTGIACQVLASRPTAPSCASWPRRSIEYWRLTSDEFAISRTVSRKLLATVTDEFRNLP